MQNIMWILSEQQGRWKQVEDPQKAKKLKIFLVVLLVILVVSNTALGILLISLKRQSHPPVTVSLETAAEPTDAPTETTMEPVPETTAPPATKPAAAPAAKPAAKTTAKPRRTPPASPPREVEATLMQLHSRQSSDNIPFYVENLFPGDAVTRYYCIRVSHSHGLTLRYHATVRQGYEHLAEVLQCRIAVDGEILYEGLMRDMPASVNYAMPTHRRVTQDVVYEITVYLDTSVGNAYQNQKLWADFNWWIEETNCLEPPRTGDSSHIFLWALAAVVSLLLLLGLLVLLHQRDRRLARLLFTLILLALAMSTLFVTAYAASWMGVSVKGNFFQTGTVEINLNDGEAVTTDEMFTRFEPGMTVETTFFIRNLSTDPVFYKIYLKDVEGDLKNVLVVSILDGTDILYTGPVSGCTRLGVGRPTRQLALNGQKELTISFYFPKDAGNAYQQKELTFVLCADATQIRNNANGEFNE